MIRTLKFAAFLAVALSGLGASAALAQPAPAWGPPGETSWGWDRNEWARPPNDRPGYENLNDCQPGTHGIPFPNGNGFRCVVDAPE